MAAIPLQSDIEVVEELHPAPTAGQDEEIVNLDAPIESVAAAKPAAKPAAAAPAATDEDDDVPADLKKKTPKELARMYQEAQSLIGRQGSELGELRKRADKFVEASLASITAARQPQVDKPAAEPLPEPKIEDVDFFAKPGDAIARAIENHPVIKQIKATLGEAEKNRAVERATHNTERFNAAHPDASTIMQDPEFRTWVGASRVRSQLLQRAHNSFDFEAGDEIFGTWKALKGAKAPVAAPAAPAADVSAAARTLAASKKRTQQLNDVAAPTSGNGTSAKPTGTKKIYRRADVLRLMETDEARYAELAPEIELAYRENRVR